LTTEIRKAALDTILERIHLEGHQEYDRFAKQAATWFADHSQPQGKKEDFVEDFSTGTDFHRFNEVSDHEVFLERIYEDAMDAIVNIVPSKPRQLYVEDIDSFSRVTEVSGSDLDVDKLRDISESEVKAYFREIIDEPFEQHDWGGELNDLFTSQIEVDGRRVDTAIMLKGPSVESPLQIADSGTRGDQFQRLFQSPADLYIIQFNGKIEDRTNRHIKGLSMSYDAPMFSIIDGTDTARVLRAYGKI
jgi:hypothetical protein